MSISIKYFKVLDTTTGKMQQNGRKTSSELSVIKSQNKMITGLIEQDSIPGTPSTISSGPFYGNAHMSTKYIEILRTNSNTTTDGVFIPTIMRVIKLCGTTSARNVICYGFSAYLTTTPENIEWNVLFANPNAQENGDYRDIELPDTTKYPRLYLGLLIINKGWDSRTVVDATNKICSLPSNLNYFCINPAYSNLDVNMSHCMNIQGYNSSVGYQNRICVAFEDWKFSHSDKDYNDFVISIQNRDFDENVINDMVIS